MAFFQVAGDNYSDNGFQKFAYGNENEVIRESAVTNHKKSGYGSQADRGIPIDGQSPWVMLFDNAMPLQKPEARNEDFADIGFVVRSFEADLGTEKLVTPHINLFHHSNRNSQIGFELGLPRNITTVPAGSKVKATVEYLVIPSIKDRYYGDSDYLTALPMGDYKSTRMMMKLATDNRLQVEASVGEVVRAQPVEIQAVPDHYAAEFSITGGLGYVPVTIKGLGVHDGWELQKLEDGNWEKIDQSVIGKDFWQARFDEHSRTYEVVYNIPNRGTNR